MFVSALMRYCSSGEVVDTNAQLRWEHLPGSVPFVVYTDECDTSFGGRPVLESRGLVVKITRLFRFPSPVVNACRDSVVEGLASSPG
jgi:hypothetical protein